MQKDIIPTCRELGVGVVAYSPLGRGFLTGKVGSLKQLGEGDYRSVLPRFQAEALEKVGYLLAVSVQCLAPHRT